MMKHACRNGDAVCLERLYNRADWTDWVLSQFLQKNWLLVEAIKGQHLNVVLMLLRRGASVSPSEIIFAAAAHSKPAILQILLDAGARVGRNGVLIHDTCRDVCDSAKARVLKAHSVDVQFMGSKLGIKWCPSCFGNVTIFYVHETVLEPTQRSRACQARRVRAAMDSWRRLEASGLTDLFRVPATTTVMSSQRFSWISTLCTAL
jgi:hypothetical protein